MGRVRKARALFRRLLALGNDLGLFAEEYDPVAQRQLGNFPQAFSHIGLINSVHALVSAAGGVWELADLDGKAPPKKKEEKKEKKEKASVRKRSRARTPRR